MDDNMEMEPGTLRKSQSHDNCCVFGCTSSRQKTTDLMYHKFPPAGQKIQLKNEFGEIEIHDRRKLWEIKLRLGKKLSCPKVCSLHFASSDYESSGWSSIKRLKKTAIPTLHLPESSHKSVQNLKKVRERQERFKKRSEHCSAAVERQNSMEMEYPNEPALDAVKEQEIEIASVPGISTQTDRIATNFVDVGVQTSMSMLSESKSVGIQVNTNKMLTVCDFVKNERQLNTLTGIHCFALLHMLVRLASNVIQDKRVHRLSLYKRIFLTFMKMKLDVSYSFLSVLFGISSQRCKTLFHETIISLAPILKLAIPFPSKEEILQNMPKCFKSFKNVRIVLDCTEVPVQKNKKLCCQIKCYSHYKGTTTLKFLTGVTPGGLISYVSPAYGGRVSDKAIFENSGLLDYLDMYQDAIMVDKGFLIENLCESFGIKLVRPPFLKKKKKLSQAEAVLTSKIASARVHVERSNQRIKTFKILTNRFPVNLVPLADYIFIIICGIVNLQNPILADDKFL